ncbi:MAG: sensor histidine kinase [Bryobacteraceae bacterium]|nr:sensor histidine kinase [Bryobacteraceae bacterium]
MQVTDFDDRMLAERRFLWALVRGFGVVILLMLVSGFLLLGAIRVVGEGAEKLSDRQLAQTELIDRLQREQASVGELLYRIAEDPHRARLAGHREEELRLRGEIQALADEAIAHRLPADETAAWLAVKDIAAQMFEAIESSLRGDLAAGSAIGAIHHRFVAAVVRLTETSYRDARSDQTEEVRRDAHRFMISAALLGVAVALALVGAVASVVFAWKLFGGIERQVETLRGLSLHILDEQELSARRFSQELHDEFGQTLNAIEATLSVVRADGPESRARLDDARAMVKDSIANAREMSRLLRPTILDDFGLDAGLRELARGFSQRTGIVVDYTSSFRGRLPGGTETHLFRIAQEALTNVSKHSTARRVWIELKQEGPSVTFRVADDGGGLPPSPVNGGLGLIGMSERARAAGGRVSIRSTAGEGVEIAVTVPFQSEEK